MMEDELKKYKLLDEEMKKKVNENIRKVLKIAGQYGKGKENEDEKNRKEGDER